MGVKSSKVGASRLTTGEGGSSFSKDGATSLKTGWALSFKSRGSLFNSRPNREKEVSIFPKPALHTSMLPTAVCNFFSKPACSGFKIFKASASRLNTAYGSFNVFQKPALHASISLTAASKFSKPSLHASMSLMAASKFSKPALRA